MDHTERAEYKAGIQWARKNENRLVESYTSDDIIGGSLRTKLFEQAAQLYPSKPGDMESDLAQTIWVLGAFRHVIDTLPTTKEAMRALWDASLELGQIFSAELGKLTCYKSLKAKPPAWWTRKLGQVAPKDVVAAAEVGWRIRRRREGEKRLEPQSMWEVLVDVFGTREMCALDRAREIEFVKDGDYWYYWVHADEIGFQMIMRPVMHEGRMINYPGELIG